MTSLISAEYRAEQQLLHLNPNYGVASRHFAPMVGSFIKEQNITSVTDYGAGKQRLKEALEEMGCGDFSYAPYDPAYPEYGDAIQSDLVCCIDVLEHIEEEYLTNVLADLKRCTRHYGFFTIHTQPAVKVLSDGRNAHLIQEDTSWWLPRLAEFFEIRLLKTLPDNSGFYLLAVPK